MPRTRPLADYLYLAGYPALYAGIVAARPRPRLALRQRACGSTARSERWPLPPSARRCWNPSAPSSASPTARRPRLRPTSPIRCGDILLLSFVVGASRSSASPRDGATGCLIAGGFSPCAIADGAVPLREGHRGRSSRAPFDRHSLDDRRRADRASPRGPAPATRTAAEPNVNRSLFFPSLFAIIAVALQVHDLTPAAGTRSRPGSRRRRSSWSCCASSSPSPRTAACSATVRRESVTDALTGLGNRRKLLTDLQDALESGGLEAGHGVRDLRPRRLQGLQRQLRPRRRRPPAATASARNLAAAVKPFGIGLPARGRRVLRDRLGRRGRQARLDPRGRERGALRGGRGLLDHAARAAPCASRTRRTSRPRPCASPTAACTPRRAGASTPPAARPATC